MVGLGKVLGAYLKLMRPAEWSKSFGNMLFAAVFAAYAYGVGIPLFEFSLGIVSVVLLWSGLYALNDVMDWQEDAKHSVKKKRVIPSGLVSPPSGLAFSYLLLLLSLSIAILLQNVLFFMCELVMLVNQLMYTSKPFSLKKRAVFDLVSGSLINPVFRFYAGWVLIVPYFNAPLLAITFVVGLQFGGYGLYRLMSAEHDKKLGYKSSVVVFKEKTLRFLFYASIALGGLSFLAMPLFNVFSPATRVYGWLPLKYLWLALGSLVLAPLYWKPMKKPGEASMESIYRVLYAHYILFIAGFVAFLYI